MKKFDTLIVGNYKVGNFGDDLLLKSCLDHLKGQKIKVLSTNNADFLTFPAGIKSLFTFKRYIDPFLAILGCQKVLFGGGGIFNSDRFMSFVIWLPILVLALLFKKDVYIFGHSFSSKPGILFSWILNKVKIITVRDKKSLNFLKDANLLNCKIAKDLALELKYDLIPKSEQKYLLINYRYYKNIDINLIKALNENLTLKAKSLNLSPLFCAFDYNSDKKVFEDLNLKFIYAKDLNKYLPHIKYFACMRLHASIFMLKNKIPGLGLSYASKVKGLLETYGFRNYIDLQSTENFDSTLKKISFESNFLNTSCVFDNPWELLK